MKMKLKPIGKAELVNVARLDRVIQNIVDGRAMDIKADFETTTQTWNNRPVFTIKKDGIETRIIQTDSLIYFWINDGTKSYPIPKVPGKTLRFKAGSKPKTRPERIGSTAGRPGTKWVSKKQVIHPGIKSRRFDKVIGKKWKKLLPQIVQRAIAAEFD